MDCGGGRFTEGGGAEEIVAALQQDGLELARHDFLHERNVLEHELLLQGDGVGGDDRLALRAERVEHGGDKVGEGFADARARLDDDVGAAFQRSGDGARHALLLGADLDLQGAVDHCGLQRAGGKEQPAVVAGALLWCGCQACLRKGVGQIGTDGGALLLEISNSLALRNRYGYATFEGLMTDVARFLATLC